MEHIKHHLKYHRWPALLLVALFVVTTWPFVSRVPYNWDAGQFVLGVQHFSLQMHQPHPPGYPAFIVLGKFFALFMEPHTALLVVSVLFAAGSVVALYCFIWVIWNQRWLALMISLAWLTNPLFWLYRETALTYTIDACAAITMALLTYLAITRFRVHHINQWMYISAGSLALFAAFRPSIMALLFPLIVVQWIYYYVKTKQWKSIAFSAGGLGLAVLAWYVPLVLVAGGWSAYTAVATTLFTEAARTTSVVYGAPWSATWQQIQLVWHTYGDTMNVWLLFILGGVVYFGYSLYKKTWSIRWPLVWIALAWAGPATIVYTLVHFGQKGYILIVAPLTYLAVAAILHWAKNRLTEPYQNLLFLLFGFSIAFNAVIFLWATPVVGHPNFIPRSRTESLMQKLAHQRPLLFHMNARMITDHTQKIQNLLQVIQAYDPSEVVVITGRNVMYPAINGLPIRNDENFRELAAVLPDYQVVEVAPGRAFTMQTQKSQTKFAYDNTVLLNDSVQYVIFPLTQIDDAQLPDNILLERMSGYSIGVMTRPFTFMGFTFERARDLPLPVPSDTSGNAVINF